MKFITVLILATALSSQAVAKHAKPTAIIPSGSKIYVNSNDGFDTFLMAALQAKRVQLQVVSTPEKADYVLDSALFHSHEASAGAVKRTAYAMSGRTSEAAVKLTSQTGDKNMVWAYAVSKGMWGRGKQSVAEACAKHLGQVVGAP